MVAQLVGLKWRLLLNGLRADVQRRIGLPLLIAFLLGITWWMAGAYRTGAAAAAEISPKALTELSLWAVLIGWLVWTTLPVILFPLDETLSPMKFSLLPIPDRDLILGLAAAALVTPPIVAPLIMLATNLDIFFSASALVVGIVGSALIMGHMVVATQSFSALITAILRTRRGRDSAFLIVGALGFAGFILQRLVARAVGEFGIGAAALEHPLSGISWLIPPLGAQRAIAGAFTGDWAGVVVGLISSTVWLLVLARLWLAAVRYLVVTPEAPVRDAKQRSRSMAVGFGWSRIGVMASKELRFYFRDPRMRMVWTGGVVFLGILAGSVVVGSTQIDILRSRPAITMAAPAVVLFIGLPIALNQFGWERNAASFLFALPLRPFTMLLAKNLASGLALSAEAVILSLIFAVITQGWAFLVYVPPLIVTAVGCQLAVGNLVSVLTPLRLPPPGTDLFAQATEQGCLALGSQLFAFAFIGALMILPASAMVLVSGALGPEIAARYRIGFTVGSFLYGIVVYLVGLWIANAILKRRMPEMVSAVQTV